MQKTARLLMASIVLGLLSLGAFVLGRLALTDIFHGEPDLTLEWNVVSLSFWPILAFHLVSVIAAVTALRHVRSARANRS